MADQSQLNILLQGVEAWNEWREHNPSADLDLTGTRLNGANLRRANLSGVDFYQTHLRRANLAGADLSGTNLSETMNLTQEQIDEAYGDEQTKLPEHLNRPAAWS
jgi:uncharacterized protein YjbI with pentapeptide repeats